MDHIRNQNGIGAKELLVVSFGTSYHESRRLTIGAIEDELERSFPDYSVRRAFSSNMVIRHVERCEGIHIDQVQEALERAAKNGVRELVIQPTHIMNGLEYDAVRSAAERCADAFEKIGFGEPLLSGEDDLEQVMRAIVDWTAEYDDGETAVCFMGHGTGAASNQVYRKMQERLTKSGFSNYYIGTVEASPNLDDVVAKVKEGSYRRVVLEPFMVVAGDHANHDMAGEGDASWKTVFEREGFEVICLLRGLGENKAVRGIYVEHARRAMEALPR